MENLVDTHFFRMKLSRAKTMSFIRILISSKLQLTKGLIDSHYHSLNNCLYKKEGSKTAII